MRIALVVQGGVHPSGREEVVPAVLWLVERLARRHAVHVFALRHAPEPCTYPLVGATVHDLGGRSAPAGLGVVRLLPALLAALRRAGPFDVIHGYMGGPPGALAALCGRRLRVPVVVTLDDGELVALAAIGYGLQLSWRGRLLVALSTRLAARLTVCSRFMGEAARARGFAPEELPLGVDTSVFTPPGSEPPGPPWRLLHVASLSRVKDPIALLQALARVVPEVGDVHLDVVGRDTLGGVAEAECRRLGLDAHVAFHGFRPTDDVALMARRAHLFVLSSRHDAAGVAVLEAAACGVPSVGTAVGYVADGAPDRAWAVPVGDTAGLAGAVVTLLRDPARRKAMGQAALAWARAHDADWTAARFEAIYGETASVGSKRHGTSTSRPTNRSSDARRQKPWTRR